MNTLIVTLPTSLPTPTTPCSIVLTRDGQTISLQTEAAPALWPDAADGEIVAVVPASQLSWHRLNLPKGTLDRGLFQDNSPSRLRAVIEGLIEDRLLDEPEQLHFALEPRAEVGVPTWTALCNRNWLIAWLQALEQAGKPIARIVPQAEPLSADAGVPALVQIVGTPDSAHILWSSSSGVTLLPLGATSLALVAAGADEEDATKVVAEPAVAALAEQYFPGRITLQTGAQRALAAAGSAWDLAQFELLRSRRARTQKRLSGWASNLLRAPHWKPARWAALALVVVNVAGLQAWAWKEQSALTTKRNAIRDVLTTTFPDVRVVVDAPLQMERSLSALQRQNGAVSSADLEEMLGRFQAVAPEIPAPAAIEFVAGELKLKLPTVDAVDPDSLQARMRAYGYAVQMQGDTLVLKQERRP
ncbi:MAG TPA: type II secretion system protein GspL [Rhodoferax sp.]|jgi:general secretion pathway protein L|nr:type II secretion system protein GspL [Rhodoferax sp.]HPW28952.1 type II secretion system protein GspL [Rhodoferax sp.]